MFIQPIDLVLRQKTDILLERQLEAGDVVGCPVNRFRHQDGRGRPIPNTPRGIVPAHTSRTEKDSAAIISQRQCITIYGIRIITSIIHQLKNSRTLESSCQLIA